VLLFAAAFRSRNQGKVDAKRQQLASVHQVHQRFTVFAAPSRQTDRKLVGGLERDCYFP